MRAPIYDFVKKYADSGSIRAHMPGHKGRSRLGAEELDITEIRGAESLYDAVGIIRESEENAEALFGARTVYSAEGSSLSIRGMLATAVRYAASRGRRPVILAARNVHKSFVYGAGLLDIGVEWIYGDSYLACEISEDELIRRIDEVEPIAVYITTPDYLGNMADVRKIADICHERGVLLLVDSAHGSYLRFLKDSLYPTDIGADMCVSSAHKTLPVLTGGGYLHISESAPRELWEYARSSMELFGSTSPSFLILQSLDICNVELASGYSERIAAFAERIADAKRKLNTGGYLLAGEEPLKITVLAKEYGYLGTELAALVEKLGISPEFSDRDHLVLMLTPDIRDGELSKIVNALLGIERRTPITSRPPIPAVSREAMSLRAALLSPFETVPVSNSVGRILATASVGCPPAIPIAISGEVIDERVRDAFLYYGIDRVSVVKE